MVLFNHYFHFYFLLTKRKENQRLFKINTTCFFLTIFVTLKTNSGESQKKGKWVILSLQPLHGSNNTQSEYPQNKKIVREKSWEEIKQATAKSCRITARIHLQSRPKHKNSLLGRTDGLARPMLHQDPRVREVGSWSIFFKSKILLDDSRSNLTVCSTREVVLQDLWSNSVEKRDWS